MQKQIKNALILLLAFFAVIAIMAILTDSFDSLQKADLSLFSTAALFFIASIVVWLFSWSALMKSRTTTLWQTTAIGFGCVFASLTPVQVGADALRSIKLKEHGKVSYSESISASMIVKGLKFLFIALTASISFITLFLNPALEPWVKAALLSGFSVVALATLLFLLPLNQRFGLAIASAFRQISRLIKQTKRLDSYFQGYSAYLQTVSRPKLLFVLLLALLSLFLEFLALFFSFLAAGAAISIVSALALFSILAILERTPFLPRGIGVVEAVGFIFLSTEAFTSVQLAPSQIGAVIILFDVARLVIPTIASLVVYSLLPKILK
jgi:uncharacterized protein (TIRG00374 family)